MANCVVMTLLPQVFRQDVTVCQAGENVGVIVRGIKRELLERGMVLAGFKSLELHNRYVETQ